jgi:flagellar basal body rod protein FlgG
VNLSSLSGMQAGSLLLAAAADNTANLDTPGYRAQRVDLTPAATGGVTASLSRAAVPGVDYTDQAATQVVGSFLYAANARAIRAQAEVDRSLFDIVG